MDSWHDGAADGTNDLAQLADAAEDSDHPEHPQDPQRLDRPAVPQMLVL